MCESSVKRVAVFANDLCFSYNKSEEILNKINIRVNNSNIYGLLGPSGCGKTTLLKCILGRIQPNRGDIQIFGLNPGSAECGVPGARVGYMPQELGLCSFLSIAEILTYFGKIFFMNNIEIKEKSKGLIKLLGFSQNEKLIGELSGGQKRRISLACALIHSPPLLILDEPTVGTDPLLRETIWLHLQSLCQTGVTIILTTHYIEEARNADVVAFMRSGQILAEEEPKVLLDKFCTQTLEEVFLKLCHSSEDNGNNNSFVIEVQNQSYCYENEIIDDMNEENAVKTINSYDQKKLSTNVNNSKDKPCLKLENNPDRNSNFTDKQRALLHKNLKRLCRNWLLLTFYILAPSLQLGSFIFSLGGELTNLNLAVFNEELSSNITNGWGQLFVNSIDNNTFNIIQFNSYEEAMDSANSGQTYAVIDINDRFSKAMRLRSVYGSDADEETLEESQISVHIDWSNQMIALHFERHLYQALHNFAQAVAIETKTNPDSIKVPLVFEKPIHGTRTESLRDFILPGCFIIFLFYDTTAITAYMIIEEEMEGILDRSFVAGITALDFLMSHVFTQCVIAVFQTLFILILPFFVLGNLSLITFTLFTALVLTQAFCGVTYGLFLASICPDFLYFTIILVSSLILSMVVGGVFWPKEGMPMILQYVSKLSPNTLAINSVRNILYRGWNLNYFGVNIGFIVTCVWTFIFLILSFFIFRKRYQIK